MRTPARNPSQADAIDNVVTTARPNSTSDAVLRERLRTAFVIENDDPGPMIPRDFARRARDLAAIWRSESCNFIPCRARYARSRERGEGTVKREVSGSVPLGEFASGTIIAGVLPDHREQRGGVLF